MRESRNTRYKMYHLVTKIPAVGGAERRVHDTGKEITLELIRYYGDFAGRGDFVKCWVMPRVGRLTAIADS